MNAMTVRMQCPHAVVNCTTCENSEAAREWRKLRAENERLRAALLVVAQHCTDVDAKTYALNAWRATQSEGDPR